VLGEFIGTTLFLFFAFAGITVAKLQGLGPPNLLVLMYISATFGASLTVNAWIFFRISGGLFNPAVRSFLQKKYGPC
jgi:aquaporin related protein